MRGANAKRRSLWKNPVITCNTCGLKQKVKSTTKQCYVQLYVDVNAAKVTVTAFHDTIKNLPINEDNIKSFFLELPILSSITYNNKTKIVEAISI